MSQQINLLTPQRDTTRSAVIALVISGVALGALAGYWALTSAEVNRLREAADVKERNLARSTKALKSLQEQTATPTLMSPVQVEIDALRPKAEALAQLLEELKAGGIGSPEGHSPQLRVLGSVGEEGLWLTKVTVSKAGKSLAIEGRAFRSESVMRYARKLNQAFGPLRVQFNSLEMTPQDAKTGDPAPTPATVDFRLS
jgi:Tfp pilus assembly protein PilN